MMVPPRDGSWRTLVLWSALFVIAGLRPLGAHHSFFGEFDRTQPMTVTGTVTRVEWRNPHIQFGLDVTDKKGRVTSWTFSGNAASARASSPGPGHTTVVIPASLRRAPNS